MDLSALFTLFAFLLAAVVVLLSSPLGLLLLLLLFFSPKPHLIQFSASFHPGNGFVHLKEAEGKERIV
jgi:hypothetical protein